MLDKILFITEILELALKYKKVLFVIVAIPLSLFLLLAIGGGIIHNKREIAVDQQWKSICTGDSIFVRKNIFRLSFFKKGREKLDGYEQREIKYRREDTLNFVRENDVPEKYFYTNNTSFVGICIGKDSSITEAGKYDGHRWLMIIPSYEITHPPASESYDYSKRNWTESNTSYNFHGMLSNNYFVNFSDVQLKNNDSIFK